MNKIIDKQVSSKEEIFQKEINKEDEKNIINKQEENKLKNSNEKQQKAKKALFPGSFSPFHNGHLVIVREMLNFYLNENITILVANNPAKKNTNNVSLETRKELIEIVLKYNNIDNIKVEVLEENNSTPNFYIQNNFDIIVRGSREEEKNLKNYNFNIAPEEKNLLELYQEFNPEINFHYIVFHDETSSTLILQNFNTHKDNSKMIDESIFEKVERLWTNKIY